MNYNIKMAVTCDVVGQADVTAISGYTPLNPSKGGCTGTRGFCLVATDQVITRTDIGRALIDRQTDRPDKRGMKIVCSARGKFEVGLSPHCIN
jgi:hypothetical protein